MGPLLSPFEARARMSRRRAIRPSEELVGWSTLAFDLHRNLIYSANKGSNADKPLPAIVFENIPTYQSEKFVASAPRIATSVRFRARNFFMICLT